MSIRTNRALYQAVRSILEEHGEDAPSLEQFLAVLRTELAAHQDSEAVSTDAFVLCLKHALASTAAAVDGAWREQDLSVDTDAASTSSTVDRVLRSQILDMQDANASGDASNELRYFGAEIVRSGSGTRATHGYWVNWDARSYVECGIQGAFGGWTPEEGGTRQLVDGDVAVLGPDGAIVSVPAEEVQDDERALLALTWADIDHFLWAGQNYE